MRRLATRERDGAARGRRRNDQRCGRTAMTLVARYVDVPANPLRVARALAGEPGFSFLWTATGDGPSYVACHPVDSSTAIDPEPALDSGGAPALLAAAPRWIGVLPYECRRDIERPAYAARPDTREEPHLARPLWLRYGAVVCIDRDVVVVGDRAQEVDAIIRLVRRDGNENRTVVAARGPGEPDGVHVARIEKALEHILEGDVYVVNVARRFDFDVEGRPVDLVARLAARARAPFAAALEWDGLSLAGSSPELLLDLDVRGRMITKPIKGTRPRGRDADEDRRLAEELGRDPKEIGALPMAADA